MGEAKYISAVVPVYNEEGCLKELYRQLSDVLKKTGKDYEIIFVDDGSRDASADILNGIDNSDANVKVITFLRNFGQHAAVIAGFAEATAEIVVTLDADLQNPPSQIPKLISKLEEGYDIASGRRIDRKDNLPRKYTSLIMNIIISKLTGVKLRDYGCMLRAYRKPIIEYLLKYGQKCVYIPAFTSWLSSNIIEVPVEHHPRPHGKSKYSLLKFLRQAFDLITAYTLFPIQLISITGVIFALVGFLLACYLMSFRFFFGATSTLTTFIAALLFFSGLIIFFMGIISEYLARTYIEARKSPLYIIKERPDEKN